MEPGRMAKNPKKRRLESDTNLTVPLQKLQKIPADMFCWGSTVYGELGLGGIEEEIIRGPREVNFQKATEIHQIACGDNYTVLITNDGQVYSCGNNDYGQLGHEKPRRRLQLVEGVDAFVFKRVACGASHTMAVNEWGHVFTWGNNLNGQLGLSSTETTEPMPRMIKTLVTSVVVQIACGLKHTMALTSNGQLYSWGLNDEGQLGHGTDVKFELKPRRILALDGIPIAFIACGGYHSMVVSKSGVVYAWGRNTFGQLGVDSSDNFSIPNQLKTLRNAKVRYVVCGEDFSAFLTMDGGVFTCGAGMYGQLGHGSNNNEILPRQVVELMGSVVTQICCGKRHMLALVSACNRVYAWGLGGAGQLGINATKTVTTPNVVLGPWAAPYNGVSQYATDCVVKHIFSGSDHCFATVTKRNDCVPADDCRVLEPSSQILTIDEEHLAACQKVPASAQLDHDLMTYLETVFSSLACFNASFLLEGGAHYGCSSKISGVDVQQTSKIFGIIQDLQNNTIQELIFTSITDSLLPSLPASPMGIETLRVYVTLALYHGFLDPKNHRSLHDPFARALLSLKKEMQQVIGVWWCAANQIFHRLIRVFKSLVLYYLKSDMHNKNIYREILQLSLRVLEFLHKLNEPENSGPHVPYSAFYLPELAELLDIRTEYLRWLAPSENGANSVLFCNYPFLFDAPSKTILLETDQAVQMHSAINESATRLLRRLFQPIIEGREEEIGSAMQFLMLNVSREHLVDDAIRELTECRPMDLKKPLRVKFHGEEAEDAGGVKKEFFMLILKEVLDPKYGMFKQYEETRAIWFIPDSLEDDTMYALIGILCGLAIYNFIIIDLPFPLALYKKLLQEPVCLADLKDLSPIMAKSLQDLLEYEGDDLTDVFCLNFEVTREVYDEKKTFELIPNGSKIMVTRENRQEFVDLYVDYVFNKSVEAQFDAFYRGFHKVCGGGRVLKLFHSQELMAVVVGNENYDWKELEENARYKDGYSRNDPTIVMFWEIFHSLDLAEKKKFLLFLTGSDRIPIAGMKAIKITIQPMADDRFLPVAHTCFDLLDLPRYQTRERLRYKLLQAIQQTQGFSLV